MAVVSPSFHLSLPSSWQANQRNHRLWPVVALALGYSQRSGSGTALALPWRCSAAPFRPPPWRSERSHARQTSDRAASGKPWPNYCNPSDCFNLLHNMFSVTGHAQHVVSSSSSDHRPEDSAAATHVAWPGMVGPGHFPPPPPLLLRARAAGVVGRVGW